MKKRYVVLSALLVVLLLGGCAKNGRQDMPEKNQAASDTARNNQETSEGTQTDAFQEKDNSQTDGPRTDASASSNIPASDDASEMITLEEAKSFALSNTGYSEDAVTFSESKLDSDDGRVVYEIEFFTNDTFEEYEYKLDAYTGEAISSGHKQNTQPPSSNSSQNTISEDDAKALALERVPGASVNDLREFKTDYDDGRTEYEGEIYYNGVEYEFEIDASNGSFLSWEEDRH